MKVALTTIDCYISVRNIPHYCMKADHCMHLTYGSLAVYSQVVNSLPLRWFL